MKLNSTPRHYMPLPQNQSDDDESGSIKEINNEKIIFKSSYDASERFSKRIRQNSDDIDPKNLPMSPMRLFMFIISLILCVLFVVIFVFFVPCTMSENLNGMGHLNFVWRREFLNMSFTSPLDYAQGPLQNNLVILGFTSLESGLVAFQESNGHEVWRLHLHSLPKLAFCRSLDVNSDGEPDCLVIGNNGLLTAVDVKNGLSLWYLHNHSNLNKACSIDGPIVVPDFDGDGIEEIIISYNMKNHNISQIALVSGSTGQIIGSLIELPGCKELVEMFFTWQSHNETYLALHCINEGNRNILVLSSRDVYDAALNETNNLSLNYVYRIPAPVKNIDFFKVTSSKNQLIIMLDGVKFMMLEISSHLDSHIIWESGTLYNQPMRILIEGVFTNNTHQLIISGSNIYHSKVFGINMADGKEIWSLTYDNGYVTSAAKLPNFFEGIDGLILKTISPKDFLMSNERNMLKGNIKSFEESYMLVMAGKVPVTKILNTDEIKVKCTTDQLCMPNVYSANSTILVRKSMQRNSFEILSVTSTLQSNCGTKIILKHLHLEHLTMELSCRR